MVYIISCFHWWEVVTHCHLEAKAQKMQLGRKFQQRNYRKTSKHLGYLCHNRLNSVTSVCPSKCFSSRVFPQCSGYHIHFTKCLRQKRLLCSWWWHRFCPCSAICHIELKFICIFTSSGELWLLRRGCVSFILLSLAINSPIWHIVGVW